MIGVEQVYGDLNQPPTTNESFTDCINADGYPTSCMATNKITNQFIKSFDYSYLALR